MAGRVSASEAEIRVSSNNRVRALRAERGWSQTDLAVAVGVSRQAIHAIEAGKYDPSLSLAFRISDVFAASIESIFRPNGAGE